MNKTLGPVLESVRCVLAFLKTHLSPLVLCLTLTSYKKNRSGNKISSLDSYR